MLNAQIDPCVRCGKAPHVNRTMGLVTISCTGHRSVSVGPTYGDIGIHASIDRAVRSAAEHWNASAKAAREGK
jgi:hypothetical protein